MTTSLTTTVLDHTGNAGFQAWATELFTQITASGLVQTADTGQLATPVVAARPGTSTSAGYWIFRLNDALNGSRPILLKIEVGTGGSATGPQIWVTVGSGSNGSGTINGTSYLARTAVGSGTAPSSTAVNYPSYVCTTAGFFGFSFKAGAFSGGTSSQGFLTVGRSVDDNGAFTTDAIICSYNSSTFLYMNWYSHVIGLLTSGTNHYCLVPGATTSALTGGNAQFFKHYIALPAMRPLLHQGTILTADVSDGATFTATQVGAVSHTYVAPGPTGSAANNSGLSASRAAMLWE